MDDATPDAPATPGIPGRYDVVLLVEQELTAADAAQVVSLHEGLEDPVVYHVILPLDDAAEQIEASMGSLTTGEMMPSAGLGLDPADLQRVREECEERSQRSLTATESALRGAGATLGTSTLVEDSPIDALARIVGQVDGREAIILTRPHVVAEFFHLDWTSQARRRIGVPVLHLLEHETFDEQAGGGEGVTGV